MIKCITTTEDYWLNCKDEVQSHDWSFARLIVDQMKMYKINTDIEGVEDDGQNMYSNTYLTKLRSTLISLKHYEDAMEDLDLMMTKI